LKTNKKFGRQITNLEEQITNLEVNKKFGRQITNLEDK
jgi:hypothetical protein